MEYSLRSCFFGAAFCFAMEKDWEMMSEFDKDEIIRKKIIREL